MPRIYILLMSVLISAFYACDHRGKPYPATLSRIESLADTNPEEARPLLDRLRDSLSSFDEEQRMYYDLLDLKVNDKMYVRHTSDSLIKRITAFYETYGDRDKLLESYYYMGRVYRDLNDAPEALKYFQKALDVAGIRESTDYCPMSIRRWVRFMIIRMYMKRRSVCMRKRLSINY